MMRRTFLVQELTIIEGTIDDIVFSVLGLAELYVVALSHFINLISLFTIMPVCSEINPASKLNEKENFMRVKTHTIMRSIYIYTGPIDEVTETARPSRSITET
jgi:hypothetical protein